MAHRTDTWLDHLARERCEELLREERVGRLGVVVDGRPAVFPVCHVYVDGVIAFPTNVGTKLHAAIAWPFAAFEIDGLEDDGMAGWSVMVSGHAEEVTDEAERVRLAALRTVPWRTTPSLRWVRLIPSEITGRRILGDRPFPGFPGHGERGSAGPAPLTG